MMKHKLPRHNLQVLLAVLMSLAGLCLLFLGLYLPPCGVIAASILVAYGEVMTFAGALLGIDYHYRQKQ